MKSKRYFKKFAPALLTLPLFLFTPTCEANLPFAEIQWPADDKGHMDNPKVVSEWWYYTGKLTAKLGKKIKHFSYFMTLRYMRDVAGNVPTLDVQITDIDDNKVYANSIPLTGTTQSPKALDISAKDFKLERINDQYHLAFKVPADKTTIGLDLRFTPKKLPLPIGPNAKERGLVPMGNNTNSFYYSITRLQTEGFVQLGSDNYKVNSDVRYSSSWMDHQWGDFKLATVLKKNPWLWMGIQLADGTDINVGEFVSPKSQKPLWPALANISKADGSAEYKSAKVTPGAHKKGHYPLTYTLKIGDHTYKLNAVVPGQDKDGVWMGIMSVDGQDVLQPNASFAIVENAMIQTGTH